MRSRPPRILSPATLGASALAVVALALVSPAQDVADAPPPFGGDALLSRAGLGGMARPNLPPQGDWAEVVFANDKWIVLQNAQGQQFPVSADNIRQFYVRWAATLADASPNALAEVTGVDLGTNQVRVDHVDLYENEARFLVTPTFQRLVGFNRVYTAIDVMEEQTYGVYFPLTPQEYAIPRRLHVVAPISNRAPLQLFTEGNVTVTVVPPLSGMSVTQVTLGNIGLAKPGDVVYCVTQDAGAKSLLVSQLVLYKNEPRRVAAPAR